MIRLFKAPRSYTGENMAELYCHGNDFIVSQILEVLLKYCRLADKGEFTFRAFLNKKIDLTQAEAIGNLLTSQTKNSQKSALIQLEGKLYHKIKSILDKLNDLRILFELAIDFIEDEVPEYNYEKILSIIDDISTDLNQLIVKAPDGIITHDGLKVCLTGAPNVGKSSIFNAFLEKERAIITPIPGTTRDYLEERFVLNGFLIRLFDTAGIQETTDVVENIGIKRSYEMINNADLVFYITSKEIDPHDNETFLTELPIEKTIRVINKSDLLDNNEKELWKSDGYILCSTLKENGIDEIKNHLSSCFNNIDTEFESGIITNTRQLSCAKACFYSLEKAKDSLIKGLGIDFVAFDIQQASNYLEEIIGKVSGDDILLKIFQTFCIGK